MSFLKALSCQNDSVPPVWIMRQAGRYLPQYQKYRQKYELIELFTNPELAAEITKLPVDLLGVDAAILFSDILILVKAFGFDLQFKNGPQISPQLDRLGDPDYEKISHVWETIERIKPELSVPLIGFAGGPFTVACYLLGGVSKAKAFLYSYPKDFHEILGALTKATIYHLQKQIEAGAEAIQIFDSWAGMLPLHQFQSSSLHYLKEIVESLSVPVILFCRGSCLFADELSSIQPSCISLDWQMPLKAMRKIIPSHIAVQGNLDPDLLLGDPVIIRRETRHLVESMEGEKGFVLNLGHGILPHTPVENVKAMITTLREGALSKG